MIRLLSQTAIGLAVAGILFPAPLATAANDPPAVNWRTDYHTARKEAQESGRLIVLVVGTEDCIYCRKQDATTFRDANVNGLLKDHFFAVKVDANRDNALSTALKVQIYPTTVLASPDGKILAYLQGYISAEQFQDHAKRAILQSSDPNSANRLLAEAELAIKNADNIRGLVLLKTILANSEDTTARSKAHKQLTAIERRAADKLARAKTLQVEGQASQSLTQLAEIVRGFAGTPAAVEAATLLIAPNQGDFTTRLQSARVKDLLVLAKSDYESKRYADCLEKCQYIQSMHAQAPESSAAKLLCHTIQQEPELLQLVCDQMNERTTNLYLALAESWTNKGDFKKAQSCFHRVVQMSPGSSSAETAQLRLASLQIGSITALPTMGTK